MNRNKKIWMTIGIIIVIGVAVTCVTSSFVKRNSMAVSTEAAAAENFQTFEMENLPSALAESEQTESIAGGRDKGAEKAAAEETAAGRIQAAESGPGAAAARAFAAGSGAGAQTPETAAQPEILAADEAAPEETVAISPLDPAGSLNSAVNSAVLEDSAEQDYMEYLGEIDDQIARMRQEEAKSTTYSLKNVAETEYKLWDTELNVIYTDIMEELSEEEAAALREEERAWMKERDTRAEEAAKKNSGTSLESVEYIASLAASTRERVYELAEAYEGIVEK